MGIQSIRFGLPCCSNAQEKQTTCSLIARITAVVIGALALAIGILILANVLQHGVGSTMGGVLIAAGGLPLVVGICVKSVKHSTHQASQRNGSTSSGNRALQNDDQNFLEEGTAVTNKTSESNKPQSDLVDFAKITPVNYEKYIDVHKQYDSSLMHAGDFCFIRCDSETNPRLVGVIYYDEGKMGDYDYSYLQICSGQFVHLERNKQESFSNLKEFFNYFFQGNFCHGEKIKQMQFVTLKNTMDGKEIRCNNPYKAQKEQGLEKENKLSLKSTNTDHQSSTSAPAPNLYLNGDSLMNQVSGGIRQRIESELSRLSTQPESRYSTISFHSMQGKMIYVLFIGGEKMPYFFDSEDARTTYRKQRLGASESTRF